LIRPGLFAGCAFAFILSFDNVSVSMFLVNQKTPTLPLAIMNYVEYNFDPGVAAVSATMVILSLAVAWLIERWVGIRKVLG
jgi:putative spermidine/putrescine transport system permease protein